MRPRSLAFLLAVPASLLAQQGDLPTGDQIIKKIYDEGMQRSMAYKYGQALMDSIGPRLTGSPQNRAANDWVVKTYAAMGVQAKNEQYGTWRDWTRGLNRVELLTPRVKNLEAIMLPWSPGTPAAGVNGDVVIVPPLSQTRDSAGFAQWLSTVKGKFVLISFPQPTCRPDTSWKAWGGADGFAAMKAMRDSATREFTSRLSPLGRNQRALPQMLDNAGAAGVFSSSWSRGWGTQKMQSGAGTTSIPRFDISCEDYGLLARLAENNQHPTVHVVAESKLAAQESPVFNTIATVKGSEKPNEYVMLSSHLDSWDAGSGATDNGTGTIVMLEAMRILRAAYPNPKRTILAGHWSGEEEGDIGSAAFAADHPEILKGLQALFNQDNGTGNINQVVTNGFVDAAPFIAKWMSRMPADVTAGITMDLPGVQHDESTDSDAFDCHDTPGFQLNSADWEYDVYTWHTNRDTFDKISWREVEKNAIFVAMLAYQASEDPNMVPRTRRIPVAPPGTRGGPPVCENPPRSYKATIRPPAP
ncbi:MAG TPA: M20/M25/M40 family metallo-hydrolase [Gemmatimonadaceae bacterium]